ncbi:MAG: 50S ribosomal protein L1 [candidate division KSB1 bacterium]|nr:50S ribosomal protein L1 [candidate division KSB1 bacterium]
MKRSRRYKENLEKVDREKIYSLKEAITLVQETANAGFDESVEVDVRLGVDPRKADQNIRGTVVLPAGTGKTIRVLVLTSTDKEQEAKDAGADHVGADDLVEKIQGGWLDFDVVITTPDMMPKVGKLGKVLGPRGLMPNPKSGTVTQNVGSAVEEAKAGKIDFRVDRYGIVHTSIGKRSFSEESLTQNIRAFLNVINRLRPVSTKGVYIKNITLASTMGPGIKVDKNSIIDVT